MTRTSNARLAGFTFLLYIAAGIASMKVAGHAGATSVLAVLTSFCALVLGVTLWAITREVDPDLARWPWSVASSKRSLAPARSTLPWGPRSASTRDMSKRSRSGVNSDREMPESSR